MPDAIENKKLYSADAISFLEAKIGMVKIGKSKVCILRHALPPPKNPPKIYTACYSFFKNINEIILVIPYLKKTDLFQSP